MKLILFVYFLLEALSAFYLWRQIGDNIVSHLVVTLLAMLLYLIACFKDV
jgi:hypothetical protein